MSTSPARREYPYVLVDVFAERRLEGNMLAIFTDARGLSDDEMQALARETNLAETTFILPRDGDAGAVDVRIFTTEEELPFAGHPTLGTASWLHLNHERLQGAEAITIGLKGGPVTVTFDAVQEGRPGVFATMQQHDPVFGMVHEAEEVARVTGIALADLDLAAPIQTVSTGLPFCIVKVRSVEALGKLQIPQAAARDYLATTGAKFFYVIAEAGFSESGGPVFRSRMQFYHGEDPATGSAAGCTVSYLLHHGLIASEQQIELRQGSEVGRPSYLFAKARLTGEHVHAVFVSGRTIPVAKGVFWLGGP